MKIFGRQFEKWFNSSELLGFYIEVVVEKLELVGNTVWAKNRIEKDDMDITDILWLNVTEFS